MDGPLKLIGTVGRFGSVEPDDILPIKTALNWAGYYEIPNHGMTKVTDDAMFNAIEKFQMDHRLDVDGVVRPEGETAKALNVVLQKKKEGEEQKLPPKPKCGEGEAPVLKAFCLPGTNICTRYWECIKVPPYPYGAPPRG